MLRSKTVCALRMLAVCALMLQGCRVAPIHEIGMPDATQSSAAKVDPGRLTSQGLQRELFAFADRYQELVAQAADDAIVAASDPRVRVLFRGMKVTYVSSVVSMASAARPIDGLRDLLVAVSLQRRVWDEGGDSAVVNQRDAQRMAEVLRKLELDLYELAKRAVPAETITVLQTLIEKWRRENPGQRYVAFVRFPNLGPSPAAEEVENTFSSGGLLAPIDEVAREVHETRLLAERAIYITQRMPLLLEWQGELLYQGFFASPEVREVLDDAQAYRKSIEGLLGEIANIPERVADERRALLGDFRDVIAKERTEFLDRVETLIRSERQAVLQALSDGSNSYGPLLARLNSTAIALKEVTASLERLQGAPGGPSAGLDTTEILVGLERLALAATELRLMVNGMDALVGNKAELRGLATMDEMLSRHERRLFIYAVLLLVAFGIVTTVSILVVRHGARRQRESS